MENISVIGPGRLGGSLVIALTRAGWAIDAVVYRRRTAAVERIAGFVSPETLFVGPDRIETIKKSRVILIAAGDPEVEPIAQLVSRFISPETRVLHTSGSLSADVLAPIRGAGGFAGSMHPLVSVSDPVIGAQAFTDSFFCLDGDEEAKDSACRIVEALGGRHFSVLPGTKTLYHAAAVMASGHVVALVDAAIEVLARCGLDSERGREVIAPLLKSVAQNVTDRSPQNAITGPYARGDAAAVDRHLAALAESVEADVIRIYLSLAERSLEVAGRELLSEANVNEIRERISMAKRDVGC